MEWNDGADGVPLRAVAEDRDILALMESNANVARPGGEHDPGAGSRNREKEVSRSEKQVKVFSNSIIAATGTDAAAVQRHDSADGVPHGGA